MIDSVMAVIDRHKLSAVWAVCFLPLVLFIGFSVAFELQSRWAAEAEPHNIFDDITPQRQGLKPTGEHCMKLGGNDDGSGCVIPRLAR
jgi:hypothetical protein